MPDACTDSDTIEEFKNSKFAELFRENPDLIAEALQAIGIEASAGASGVLTIIGVLEIIQATRYQEMGQWNIFIKVTVTPATGEWVSSPPKASAYSFDELIAGPVDLSLESVTGGVQTWTGTIIGIPSQPNFVMAETKFMDNAYNETKKTDVHAF